MKIKRITADNFLGARSVDAVLTTPISLFCGPNGAGKSSIQEAVRMAITGEVVRVNLKKEYGSLVHDGAKAGGALITTEAGTYAFDVPGGKVTAEEGLPTGDAIAVALNGQRFASMTPDEKRTFLFNVTGCKASMEVVKARLTARLCDEEKIEAVLPMLRTGFPGASEFAAEKATQSKRDWRAITNATYGGKAAEKWKAEAPIKPEGHAPIAEDLQTLEDEIAQLNQQIGAAQAGARAAAEAVTKREQMKVKAESVDRIAENLDLKRTELAEFEPKVAELRNRATGTKRVGLVHDLALHVFMYTDSTSPEEDEAAELINRYAEEFGGLPNPNFNSVDEAAKAALPEHERGLTVLQNVVKNLERDLLDANAAKTAYDALEPAESATTSAGDIDALQTRLTTLKASSATMKDQLRAIESYERDVAASKTKTETAAKHHASVVAWSLVADALAPDGIPGELLAEALKPINSTLQIAAADTGWKQVSISADMAITAGDRPYALLSESEQWRVDAMVAQAIAKISGFKILMLDRMDVLDLPGRGQLLGWLDMLAEDGMIDTALLFATLKAMPTGLPETIAAFWIDGGVVQTMREAA